MKRCRVPLCDNIEVICTPDPTRPGYWFIDPPIAHPNVFVCNTELYCNENESPDDLLQETISFPNPCNVDLAILYINDRKKFQKCMEQLKEKECMICMEEFTRTFEWEWICSAHHQCCDRCIKKLKECPLCKTPILT